MKHFFGKTAAWALAGLVPAAFLVTEASAWMPDQGFRYSFQTGRCEKGLEIGHNDGYLGECGNVRGTWMRWEDLSGRNLRGANFQGADLTGSNLRDADLRGATFDRYTVLPISVRNAIRAGMVFVDDFGFQVTEVYRIKQLLRGPDRFRELQRERARQVSNRHAPGARPGASGRERAVEADPSARGD